MHQNGEETYHLGIVCFFLKIDKQILWATQVLCWSKNTPPLDEDFEDHIPVPLTDIYNYYE